MISNGEEGHNLLPLPRSGGGLGGFSQDGFAKFGTLNPSFP